MISSRNFINIQGWMIMDPEEGGLGLKGNDLFIFAIINGFAQTEGQCFCGSLAYLEEWTRSTRAGVIKNLNNLISYGLIVKVESSPTNKYYLSEDVLNRFYRKNVNLVNGDVNTVNKGVNSVNESSKQSIHNNIINNSNNINNKYKEQLDLTNKVEEVISYFNSICKSNFRSTTAGTKKLIKARLSEGFTIDDFKKVIDTKYETWGAHPFKFSNGQLSSDYLRPATLFSDKFESYLYEADNKSVSKPTLFNSTSTEVDKDVSNLSF